MTKLTRILVIDCCLTPHEQFFSYSYDDVKKLHFNEMMVITSLFYINKLSRIFIVLAH